MGKDSALRASQVIWRTVVLSGAMLGGACGGSAAPAATTTTPPPARDEIVQPTILPADEPRMVKDSDEPVSEEGGVPDYNQGPVQGGVGAPPPPPPEPAMTPPPEQPVTKKKPKKKPAASRKPDLDDSSDPCTGGESRVRGTEEDGPPRGRGFVLA